MRSCRRLLLSSRLYVGQCIYPTDSKPCAPLPQLVVHYTHARTLEQHFGPQKLHHNCLEFLGLIRLRAVARVLKDLQPGIRHFSCNLLREADRRDIVPSSDDDECWSLSPISQPISSRSARAIERNLNPTLISLSLLRTSKRGMLKPNAKF
jgi:hypothetical protein